MGHRLRFEVTHQRSPQQKNLGFEPTISLIEVCAWRSRLQSPIFNSRMVSVNRILWIVKLIKLQSSALAPMHTYATLALVSGDVDIHTLSRQMGTSVAMLERHYSKLTATMAAARLG
jgi:hypothetical protein